MSSGAPVEGVSAVELVSVPADYGEGANDGAYYPVGLLSIATHLRRGMPGMTVSVLDQHHREELRSSAPVVGISSSSALNYANALRAAEVAKAAGSKVVLGGPHATQLADQVLRNRPDLIDFVIRGRGERAMLALVRALRCSSGLDEVPSLSWRSRSGEIRHNLLDTEPWVYDDFRPFDFTLIDGGLEQYWRCFQTRVDPTVDAAFVVFTHFGCGYRHLMMQRPLAARALSNWCSYCSLNDPLTRRRGQAIVNEVMHLIASFGLEPGSKILLKCYGDNVGTQIEMLRELANAIEARPQWRNYDLGWTFYAQSSRVNEELIRLLKRVGTWNLFIGFDTIDNRIQLLNGLGTSACSHWRAVRLCQDAGIRIQAAFVLGCAGETPESIARTLDFAQRLREADVIERINSAILFIIPGAPAYERLANCEPWIRELDLLPTEELQLLWIRHFCPNLASNPADGLALLQCAANALDELSPGPHASMGFASEHLRVRRTAGGLEARS